MFIAKNSDFLGMRPSCFLLYMMIASIEERPISGVIATLYGILNHIKCLDALQFNNRDNVVSNDQSKTFINIFNNIIYYFIQVVTDNYSGWHNVCSIINQNNLFDFSSSNNLSTVQIFLLEKTIKFDLQFFISNDCSSFPGSAWKY